MKKLLTLSISFAFAMALLCNSAYSQISHGGTPYFNHAATSMRASGFKAQPVDHKKLLDEDALQVKGAGPMRIGVMQNVKIDVTEEAEIVKNTMSTHYIMAITSPGATSMSLHFSDFILPEGAELFLYDATGTFVLGSFNKNDIQPDGTFYTQAIPGEKVFVEYTVPHSSNPGRLVVDQIMHGYKNILNVLPSSEEMRDELERGPHGTAQGTCHTNVICPEGDGWRDEIRSVVAIEIHSTMYAFMCSGTLVNNTNRDFTPYVLSAFHCQDDLGGQLTALIFYFLYETNACNGNVGVSNKSITGGTTMAKKSESNGSDFWLIRLNQNIPDDYKPYYAGWDRATDVQHGAGMGIHHPGGDYKKLSIPQTISSTTGQLHDFWEVLWLQENNKGVTEEGSSGSGLFNSEHHLIGSLTGGYSYCNSLSGRDYYGRFDVSWNRGSDSTNSLRYWLDPNETGEVVLSGLDYTGVGIKTPAVSHATVFIVYPNPAENTVNVSPADFTKVEVYDIQGREVISTNSAHIDMSSLPAGVYIFRIYSPESITIQRVVKK